MAIGLFRITSEQFELYTVTEVELMIAGRVREHEHLRELLIEHALRSTPEYDKDMTLKKLLGRDPLPIDTRWAAEREAARAEAANSEAHLAMQHAKSVAAVEAGYGSMGQLSPEETAALFAEAEAQWTEGGA